MLFIDDIVTNIFKEVRFICRIQITVKELFFDKYYDLC